MRSFVYQLVQRLSEPDSGLSRNRQTALLSSPAGARARRLFRHLRSLAQDAARNDAQARLTVVPQGDGWQVRVELPTLKMVRVASLSREDLSFLARDPAGFPENLAAALRQAGALR